MTTYYVSTSGSNANSGTSTGAAWRTIQYAVDTIGAGDVIEVLSGTYTEDVTITSAGEEDNVKTLKAHDMSNKPYIQALSDSRNQLIIKASHWVIDGMRSDDFNGGGYYIKATENSITNVVIQNCAITNGGHSMEAKPWPDFPHAFIMHGTSPHTVSYCKILNNLVQNHVSGNKTAFNENITAHHNCHHILIAGNYLENVTYIGIDTIGAENPSWGGGIAHHCIIRDNIINYVSRSDYASNGLYSDGSNYILFERNLVISAGGCTPSMECWGEKGTQEYNHHIIVRNNVFDDRSGVGQFGMYIGPDHYSAFTDRWGNPAWHQLYTEDVAACHNTYIGGRTAYDNGAIMWGYARKVTVRNNVFKHEGTRQLNYLVKQDVGKAPTPDRWSLDYNLYHSDQGAVILYWSNGSNSFSGYKSASGQEANSIEASPTFTDPDNSTLKSRDYRLTSSSSGYGEGGALTTATNSGSSDTELKVGDARFFCDGWGLQDGDTIYVGGTQATISNVNYSTNTITLASAISWESGDDVGFVTTPSMGVLTTVGNVENVDGDRGPINASAGADQTIYDNDGNGSETVSLDGSGSAADTSIVSWEWSLSGVTIPDGETTSVSLGLGTHVITLTVTDEDGNTDEDSTTIKVVDPSTISDETVVRNPCLSGFDSWLAHSSGNTTWESAPSGSGVEITVTSDGGNTQLSQSGLTVKAGQVLTMRIVGEAIGSSVTFPVSLILNSHPYTNYGLYENVTFATTETIAEIEFVVTTDTTDARLMAQFATGDNVIIREFNLLGPNETGCYDESYEQVVSSGSVALTSTDDYFVDHGGQFYENGNPTYAGDLRSDYGNYDQRTGWIFTLGGAENIPDGAEITGATLKVTAAGYDGSGGLPKLRIYVENAADPAKPTSAASATSRTYIAASGAWEPGAWSNTVQYTSNDFSDAIQTLINSQLGLDDGARIHIVLNDKDTGFQSKRLAYISTAAAELDISWDAPAGGGSADSFAEEINPIRPGVRTGFRQGF